MRKMTPGRHKPAAHPHAMKGAPMAHRKTKHSNGKAPPLGKLPKDELASNRKIRPAGKKPKDAGGRAKKLAGVML